MIVAFLRNDIVIVFRLIRAPGEMVSVFSMWADGGFREIFFNTYKEERIYLHNSSLVHRLPRCGDYI